MAVIRRTADARTRLRVYLNDHLAGAVAGTRLARRCAGNNAGTPLAEQIDALADAIDADRRTLRQVLSTLQIPPAWPKQVAARAGEVVGRAKLNGQLQGYSPLGRLVELEGLCAGVDAKRNLWISLREIAPSEPALAAFDFDDLIARAERQRDDLEQLRRKAAAEALGQ